MRFRSLLRHGTSLLALVALLGGALLLAPAAAAQHEPAERADSSMMADIPGALAVGRGKATLTADNFPGWEDDTVQVGLAAYLSSDGSAYGVFSVVHREPTGELLADVRGYVECMRVEGDYAVTIGRVTDVEKSPEAAVSEGDIAAVIVQDSDSGADTMIWRFGPADTPVDCAAIPAQTIATVEQGNVVVLD